VPSVRIAQPQDSETVTRLMCGFRDHLTLSAPTDEEMATGVQRLLGDPDTEFLLAAPEDGAPDAGVAQLRFRYGVWRAGGDCLLEDLFVDPAARGAGLGRALIDATLDRARARGCRRVELDVNEANDTAIRLYESAGFSATANAYGARDLYMRLHVD
jgi:ribosomal protein S18 acetylase RimI-like enzyme